MFLLYIDDISTNIGLSIHLYIYLLITVSYIESLNQQLKDHNQLQQDLNTLAE